MRRVAHALIALSAIAAIASCSPASDGYAPPTYPYQPPLGAYYPSNAYQYPQQPWGGPQQPYPQQPGSPQPGAPGQPHVAPAPTPTNAPAFLTYARMDRATCEGELARRQVPFARAAETPGVMAPVRFTGSVNGVSIHGGAPPAQRATSKYEIFDCRLALAMGDFTAMLAARGVTEIIHHSAYRPQSESGCTPRHPGEQHCAALAVDVGYFKRRDGTTLTIEKDFGGRIGQDTCSGRFGPQPPTANGLELWGIVCEAARRTTFNTILTPNFNAEHRNHFHLEVAASAEWMMIK